MCRRLANCAPQTQKSVCTNQGPIASTGVNYCLDRASFRKNSCESPPLFLFWGWLTILFASISNYIWCPFYFWMMICSTCSTFTYLRVCYKRYRRPILEPQMGFRQVDPFLKETFQIWCLFESMADSKSKRGMIAAITQYLQAHVKQSLFLYAYDTLTNTNRITDWTSDTGQKTIEEMLEMATNQSFSNKDEPLILDAHDGGMPWHEAADKAFNNWKSFRHSPMAKRFTNVVNVIVSAGLCSTASLTFTLGNVSLFTPIVAKKQLAAGDVFEAFYEAFSGFLKGGWRVYTTGEVSSFWTEDDDITDFEEDYNKICSYQGYAISGNLREYTKMTENDYELLLKNAIGKGDALLKKIPRSQTFEHRHIGDRLDRIRKYETEYTQLRTRGGLRISPFAVVFFGRSGCGKSSLTNLTVNAGLIYNNLSAAKDRIATWADNDKFASSIRSHINAIIFDDFANTKEEFLDFSPAYRLIQVVNNVRYLAPMADVFLKGKVSLNPYFCVVSTNVETLNAQKFSNEPESILRRFYHVKVTPKKEYCTGGILDKEKIIAKFGVDSAPDVWYLSVRYYDAQNKRDVSLARFKTKVWKNKRLHNISVDEYLDWLQEASAAHFRNEDEYLKNQDAIPSPCKICGKVYCKKKHMESDSSDDESDGPDTSGDNGSSDPPTPPPTTGNNDSSDPPTPPSTGITRCPRRSREACEFMKELRENGECLPCNVEPEEFFDENLKYFSEDDVKEIYKERLEKTGLKRPRDMPDHIFKVWLSVDEINFTECKNRRCSLRHTPMGATICNYQSTKQLSLDAHMGFGCFTPDCEIEHKTWEEAKKCMPFKCGNLMCNTRHDSPLDAARCPNAPIDSVPVPVPSRRELWSMRFSNLRTHICSKLTSLKLCVNFANFKMRESHINFLERRANAIKKYHEELDTARVVYTAHLCDKLGRFCIVPQWVFTNPLMLKFGLHFWQYELKRTLITYVAFWTCFVSSLCFLIPRLWALFFFVGTFSCYVSICSALKTYEEMVKERLLSCHNVVKTHLDTWKRTYALLGLGAIMLILTTFRNRYIRNNFYTEYPDNSWWVKGYNKEDIDFVVYDKNGEAQYESQLKAQTGLQPENVEEIKKRDKEKNQWIKSETHNVPMQEPSKTTTAENLAMAMHTNLVGISSESGKTTLGFYISSNFIVVPTHFVQAHDDEDITVKIYKRGGNKVGAFFRDKLCRAYRHDIDGTDFTVFHVAGGGAMKDFRKFLPTKMQISETEALLVTRDIDDTSIHAWPILFQGTSMVTHTYSSFPGSYYTLVQPSKAGMCMSPVISRGRGSAILGFHLGGKDYDGGCGIVTLDMINKAIVSISEQHGVVLSTSSGMLRPNMGNMPEKILGTKLLTGKDTHPKSALNHLPEGACVDNYGTTVGMTSFHSNVTATHISPHVAEVFKVEQQWDKPSMKYPYQATLQHAANPSLPPGSVLADAVKCYKSISTKFKEKVPEMFKCRPLTRVETVSGRKGEKFIDPMNFNSSPGFPLSGSKRPLLVQLKPEDYPEVGFPQTFEDWVWEEFDKAVGILKTGKRCYMIWKSCLKDEPTKKTKKKMRVFQSAPLVMQLLIRMYFLPIVRIIQMNPLEFECAVGVNAEGPEWEELWDHAMKKGKDRVLAGDYSKYDVRMSARVTIAAFDVLIDIAEKCEGYSEEDLLIMKNLVHEVTYPLMVYNGDMIQLFGTNPSGQNLTVIINSVVNSLLLRSCFYTIYPDGVFKNECSFITYGDDVMGTVSQNASEFTHITYAAWLKEHDMVFTMPDKESLATHYMSESDVDFLKRKCRYNEDLGVKVGILSEDSIFKRLHSHLKSKELSPEMHSAQNISSSLHDWFYYGRDVFEDRREKLKDVANRAQIYHLCPALEISYDERVARWKRIYEEGIEEEEIKPVVLDAHAGVEDEMDDGESTDSSDDSSFTASTAASTCSNSSLDSYFSFDNDEASLYLNQCREVYERWEFLNYKIELCSERNDAVRMAQYLILRYDMIDEYRYYEQGIQFFKRRGLL